MHPTHSQLSILTQIANQSVPLREAFERLISYDFAVFDADTLCTHLNMREKVTLTCIPCNNHVIYLHLNNGILYKLVFTNL